MKPSIRQRGWWSGLVAALVVLGVTAAAWAQNTFPSSGNAGIGTTAPEATMHVVRPSGDGEIARFQFPTADPTSYGDLGIYQGGGVELARLRAIGEAAGQSGLGLFTYDSGLGERVRITGAGSVGIGTTAPQAAMHVVRSSGDGEIARFQFPTADPTSHGDLGIYQGGGVEMARIRAIGEAAGQSGLGLFTYNSGLGERVRITGAGSVGIGTTAPQAAMHVVRSSGDGEIARFQFPTVAATSYGDIGIYQGTSVEVARIRAVGERAGQVGLGLFTYNSGVGERIRITGTGNVGIGTTSPSAKLHVAGDVSVDGNIAAKYQDVAEWVPTPSPLSPGTVVVIDPLEGNRVLPTSRPYDTRVAGVVSARPGLLLGEAAEEKVKVAHSGRVTVKADARYSPIAVGDLLVTSPTPGYAMRSTPLDLGGTAIHRPGTLLGKALEPLAEGQGEILVLLTLQ